jgi:hypothetical protein
VTKHQKFEYRQVHRALIQPAAYNPNVMDPEAYKLLEAKIAASGCIQPLVWNETTGNLVGGHHRLRILDELEGTLDYILGVTVARLSPKREREMNVFLNNSQAQGHFDKDLFFALLEAEPFDLSDLGLTPLDVELEFGELPPALAAQPPVDKVASTPAPVTSSTIVDVPARPAIDYPHVLLVFADAAAKEDWLKRRQFPADIEYLSAEEIGWVLVAPLPVLAASQTRVEKAREQLDELGL